jgi:hypothetical protein
MLLLQKLWQDDRGAVLTAEAVLVSSVGVVGAVAGLGAIGHSLDEELHETAYAFRSLDQSYAYRGQCSGSAWTAGSSFLQPDLETALADLDARSEEIAATIRERIKASQKQTDASSREEEQSKPKKKSRRQKELQIDETPPRPEPNDLPHPDAPAPL